MISNKLTTLVKAIAKAAGLAAARRRSNGKARLCPCPGRSRSYTVIELVGVMAIITIIGTIIGENVIAKIRRQIRETEAANLANIADALRRSIVRLKTIPAVGDMPAQIAEELAVPVSQVTTTRYGYTRYFFAHPEFRVGTNSTSTLPYTQTVLGSRIEPQNCKVLIISSVGPIPEELIPASMDGQTFTNLWTTSDDWDALAQDVKIQHVELRDLFHRVILNNADVDYPAPYSVETTDPIVYVPKGSQVEMWLIDTTGLNLHFGDLQLQMRDIVREDVSYVYEKGRWARYISLGRNRSQGAFGELVDQFLGTAPNLGPKFYSTQQAVVDDMFNYLWYFALWATGDENANPPIPPYRNIRDNTLPHVPEYAVVSDSQSRLADFAAWLVDSKK